MIETRGTARILKSLSLGLVLALAGLAVSPEPAAAYSQRVRKACLVDFKKFCPSYKEESPALKSCMRSNGGGISNRCIDALIDAGELTKSEIQRYKSARGR